MSKQMKFAQFALATAVWFLHFAVDPLRAQTVSSVGLSLPSVFTVSGSPVTSTGTLTGSFIAQSPNFVFAGPASGSAALPDFRALVAADVPLLPGYVVFAPTVDQTITQPSLTKFSVIGSMLATDLTATTFAGKYTNAIAEAALFETAPENGITVGAAALTDGGRLEVQPHYVSAYGNGNFISNAPDGTMMDDRRDGGHYESFLNTHSYAGWDGGITDCRWDKYIGDQGGTNNAGSICYTINDLNEDNGYSFGNSPTHPHNQGWGGGSLLLMNGTDSVSNIYGGATVAVLKSGLGDLQAFNAQIATKYGATAPSDQGIDTVETQTYEAAEYSATVLGVTSNTFGQLVVSIDTTAPHGGGPLGEGQAMIVTTPGKVTHYMQTVPANIDGFQTAAITGGTPPSQSTCSTLTALTTPAFDSGYYADIPSWDVTAPSGGVAQLTLTLGATNTGTSEAGIMIMLTGFASSPLGYLNGQTFQVLTSTTSPPPPQYTIQIPYTGPAMTGHIETSAVAHTMTLGRIPNHETAPVTFTVPTPVSPYTGTFTDATRNSNPIFFEDIFPELVVPTTVVPYDGIGAVAIASVSSGNISAISVPNAGSGYTAGHILFSLSGGGGTGAVISPNVVGDAITSWTIVNPGTGYTAAPTINISGSEVLTLQLRYEHPSGTLVCQGGLTGYAVSQDDYNNGSQIYTQYISASTPTTLREGYVAGGLVNQAKAGPITVYPRADVISPFNPNSKSVDGVQFILAASQDISAGDTLLSPNNMAAAWAGFHANVSAATPFGQWQGVQIGMPGASTNPYNTVFSGVVAYNQQPSLTNPALGIDTECLPGGVTCGTLRPPNLLAGAGEFYDAVSLPSAPVGSLTDGDGAMLFVGSMFPATSTRTGYFVWEQHDGGLGYFGLHYTAGTQVLETKSMGLTVDNKFSFSGSQAFDGVQGTSTKLSAAMGSFTTNNLRCTDSSGNDSDCGIAKATLSAGITLGTTNIPLGSSANYVYNMGGLGVGGPSVPGGPVDGAIGVEGGNGLQTTFYTSGNITTNDNFTLSFPVNFFINGFSTRFSSTISGDATANNGLLIYPDQNSTSPSVRTILFGHGFSGWDAAMIITNSTTSHATLALQPAGGQTTIGGGLASGTGFNTDMIGTLSVSSGSTTSSGYTFVGTYTTPPVCIVQPQSAAPSLVNSLNSFSPQVTTTGLTITVGAAPTSAVTFGYICTGRN